MRKLLLTICALASLLSAQESLAEYWKGVKATMPGKASNGYVPPSAGELRAFEEALTALAGEPDRPQQFQSQFEQLHYALTMVGKYVVLTEKGHKGWGTFILNPHYSRNLFVEAPHPLFDAGTAEEGLAILEKAGARGLFIAGTHRCADMDVASGCSGTTTACGGNLPFRLSDAGHNASNFFTVAHSVAMRMKPQPVAISLHGNAAEPVEAELSDGTTLPARAGSLVLRFRNALEAHGAKVGSCNFTPDDPSRLKLCGTTNVQGRMSNGVSAACADNATKSTGTFLHLEQRRELRDNPDPLVQAVIDAFPAK